MKILSEKTLLTQKWTVLKEKTFQTRDGRKGSWSYIERAGGQKAVVIVPVTAESGTLILIRQFRVPFGREVIEFPAGLVDPGEDPLATAGRELKEETGYHGRILSVSPEVSTTAGLSTETILMVYMEVEEHPSAATAHESSELIEVLRIAPSDHHDFLERCIQEGVLLDAKVYVYLKDKYSVRE